MNEMMALFAGVGLAAACGFRVFVPLFITSLAASGGIDLFVDVDVQGLLGEQPWLGDPWVTAALGLATALEIGSYYIPWLDNALDAVATPAAVVAGTFISGAMMPEVLGDGAFKWLVSTVAGGGTAGVVQAATVVGRGTSSATTGGLGNPLVSTAELGGSVVTAGLAICLPVVGCCWSASCCALCCASWCATSGAAPALARMRASGSGARRAAAAADGAAQKRPPRSWGGQGSLRGRWFRTRSCTWPGARRCRRRWLFRRLPLGRRR